MSRTEFKIHKINFRNDAFYSAFAKAHGAIFNSIELLSIYPENLEVMGLFKGNEIIAVWNHWKNKRGPISFYRTPPLMPGNALAISLKSINNATVSGEIKAVMMSIADYYASMKWSIVSLNFPPEIIDLQPFAWRGFKVISFYTYRLPLPLTREAIMERMHFKLRNAIAKAQADGLKCLRVADISLVRNMVLSSLERKNVSAYRHIMDDLFKNIASEANSVAFVSYDGEKPIAASFCIIDKDKVFYLFGGYDYLSKHRGAGALCLFQSILFANEIGKSIFDFEGSMLPKVERYFRDFGADLTPYYSVNKANFLLEMIMKIKQPGKF